MRCWCALQATIKDFLSVERKDHPGDGDPRPCLFDCAGKGFTDAWGHPSGSHKYGDALDFGYFTTGKTNRTQTYGPFRPLFSDYPMTSMEFFHPARTVRFLAVLLKYFPKMRYMINVTIYEQIKPFLAGNVALDMAMNPDSNPTYHHDKHVHVYLYGFQAMGKYKEGMIVG